MLCRITSRYEATGLGNLESLYGAQCFELTIVKEQGMEAEFIHYLFIA